MNISKYDVFACIFQRWIRRKELAFVIWVEKTYVIRMPTIFETAYDIYAWIPLNFLLFL